MPFQNQLKENDTTLSSSTEKRSEEETPENSIISESSVHSNATIGSPLQSSSPSTTVRFNTEGAGDQHTLRSVRDLLSPIRMSRPNQNMIDTPIPLSAMPVVTLNSFLGNFEKCSPEASMPHHVKQELLLSEVSEMEPDEAKKLLATVLIDNVGLRQELRSKDKRITSYKRQMLSILEWKARQECDDEDNSSDEQPDVVTNDYIQMFSGPSLLRQNTEAFQAMMAEKHDNGERNMASLHSAQELTFVEEGCGIRRSLSIMQDLVMSIDVDQELLRARLKHSYHMTNQVLLGGVAGWLSAVFVKKFGKLALSATGGGLAILVYTARKGFVHVNYESIYEEISKLCGDNSENAADNVENNDVANLSDTNFSNCDGSFDKGQGMNASSSKPADELYQLTTFEKLKQAKNWITSHTYTVGGFVVSFAYNIM